MSSLFGLFCIAFLWGLVVKVALDLQHHYRDSISGPYV